MANPKTKLTVKRAVSLEAFICIAVILLIFIPIGSVMGGINMINTMLQTAFDLLINTVFYIMAIAVLAGAIAGVLTEFGVVALINKILSPVIRPIYDLPGASVIGVLTCYLSDNPAILTICDDTRFRRYFKKYQLPALTNLGTAFGMGLIITIFMMTLPNPNGENLTAAVLVGNLGAIIGSIISTRLMLFQTKKIYGKTEPCVPDSEEDSFDMVNYRVVREGGVGTRLIESLLEGGKSGVKNGMAIIPGVLIICTLVMMLTNGPSEAGTYTGAAYEGVAFLPMLAEKVQFILQPLFGFSSPSGISVPVTSLGAAGAAIGLVPNLMKNGLAHAGDVAVFTSMCMCWSGYLSTHIAMMDGLNCRKLTGRAILSHTIGGFCAGIAANWIFKLVALFL